jgi:hypothetical protein
MADGVPGGLVLLGFQLPPIGLDPEIVEMLHDARNGVDLQRPMLARDDLDQQLAADTTGGVMDA